MSLINDALKRASKMKGSSNQLQPVFGKKKGSSKAVVIGGGLVVLGLAGWLGMNFLGGGENTDQAAQPVVPDQRATFTNSRPSNVLVQASNTLQTVANLNSQGTAVATNIDTTPVVAANTNTLGTNDLSGTTSTQVATTPPVETPPVEAPPVEPPPPVQFPPIKLQAIFFRTNQSIARINGRSVKPGDVIDGVRVRNIDQQSVRIEYQGEVRSLALQ